MCDPRHTEAVFLVVQAATDGDDGFASVGAIWGGPPNVGSWQRRVVRAKLLPKGHNTPMPRRRVMSASLTPRRSKISGIVLGELGATKRTRTLSPILTGVRMSGTSPRSGSRAYCTSPR